MSDAMVSGARPDDLDRTTFVEAGAGTGKTAALVSRIVELVLSGRATIGEVAAITFTEAAGAELRERVGRAFESAAAGDPGRRRLAAAALAEIDGAPIGTLHGFARRVLAEHPFEAGLPPAIEVLDEVRSSVAFAERWGTFVDELLDGPAEEALVRALAGGVTLDHLRTVARQLNDHWDLVADRPTAPAPLGPVDAGPVARAARRAVAQSGACGDPGDALAARLARVARWLTRLESASGPVEVLAGLRDAPKLSVGNVGRQENWGGRIGEVRAALEAAGRELADVLGSAVGAALTNLLAELGRLTRAAAEDRRREGRLEYHDLLVMALQLVRRDAEVVASLHSRYRYLLIDEYQDTDPIQAELAVRIASGAPAADWRDLDLEGAGVFFVGDPKQSIYRFRRAEVELFLATRDRVGGGRRSLTTNRRSVPGIVEWVNALFGVLIAGGEPSRQPAYEPLTAERGAQGHRGEPPVVLLGGPGGEGRSRRDVRAVEAAEIASTISRAVAEAWPVGDEGRGAALGDVAVLVPTRTVVPDLQGALEEAGIPYRLETSSLVYASAEVRDLLAVLRAVDDPHDEVAIVAALRSTLFGCGDDDLFDFKSRGGSWDYRARPPAEVGPGHPVVEGQGSLAALHEAARWSDAGQIVERVLAERRMLALALDTPRPRESWRRLRYVADQARRYSDAAGGDLRGFLAWAELQAAEDTRVAEPVVPEADHDAVRVMTVHAAKGLEFPVVVVAGLNVAHQADTGARVLFGPDGAEVGVPGVVQTPGYEALAAHEREMERAERTRLLYVAMTRARDHLVVSVHHLPARQHPTQAEEVLGAAAGFTGRWRRLPPAAPVHVRREPAPLGAVDDDVADRAAWVSARRARLARAAVPRHVAATAVAKLAAPDGAGADGADGADGAGGAEGRSGDAPGRRRGRAGTAVGRAVHGVLQVVDLGTGAGLEELARAHAAAEGVEERAGEVTRLARAVWSSAEVRAACGGRHWRELYVGVPVGERVLEGFVDLLAEGPDGLWVIDYKTDRVPDDELVATAARYRLQGAAYALAVSQALGRPVARATFLFVRSGGTVAVDVDDLAGATGEVRALLAG